MTNFEKVKEFHAIYNCNIGNKPSLPSSNERSLRKSLLDEEYQEYLKGEENNNLVEIADALGDILYIVYGTAVSYGIPIDEIFEEIHASNLSKLDDNGLPIYRDDGKVMKGPNYFKPKIKEILERNQKNV